MSAMSPTRSSTASTIRPPSGAPTNSAARRIYTLRELTELTLAEIHRKRLLIDLPFGLATMQARVLGLLPNPLLTPDQVELLKSDNVPSSGALTLSALGITPTPVEAILPTYLDRFRRGGWYAREPAVR